MPTAQPCSAITVRSIFLIGWLLIALLATLGTYLYWRRVADKLDAPPADGIAVIVPIKGTPGREASVEQFLASCLAQRGVSFRLIVAVDSETDPAVVPVSRIAAVNGRLSLVVAGRAKIRGQKIHNQLAALETLGPEDRFVAFADCDILPSDDWLAQLIRPLHLGRAELVSGYRWIVPANANLASRCCALIDWSVATSGRSKRWNLCWGGSMAISRTALERIDLPRYWKNSLLDDLVLTRAARRVGIRVFAPLRVLVPSPVEHDFRSLLEFGRRQYLLVRVHAPRHWCVAGLTLMVPAIAGGLILDAALHRSIPAITALVAALMVQQLRASLRLRIARRVLAPEQATASAAVMRHDRWLLPAVHLLHLAIWLSSAFGNRLTWGGIHYRLRGFARVQILGSARADVAG